MRTAIAFTWHPHDDERLWLLGPDGRMLAYITKKNGYTKQEYYLLTYERAGKEITETFVDQNLAKDYVVIFFTKLFYFGKS
jgi:hypothetical protein